MGSELSYHAYSQLINTDNIRNRFNTQQWVALNKLVRGRKLSEEDRRALLKVGVIDIGNELTLVGRVCVEKINKKRKKRKPNVNLKRGKMTWETKD